MKNYKRIILSYLTQYLDLKKISYKKLGTKMFKLHCPLCDYEGYTALTIPNSIPQKANCLHCKEDFTLVEYAKKAEKWEDKNEEEILTELKNMLNINVSTDSETEVISNYFDSYQKNNWSLLPIVCNHKMPIEKNWTNIEHKDKEEWKKWIEKDLNYGCRTGKVSNLTVIDVDVNPIPEDIKKIMGDPLIQQTNKGFHLFYQYESDLPKTAIKNLKIDIENDGGQVVVHPSIIDGHRRDFIDINKPVIVMPKELKELLLSKITKVQKPESERLVDIINNENFNLGLIQEGSRSQDLTRIGGMIRGELNPKQTEFVLNIMNRHVCSSPLSPMEIRAMVGSIEKYRQIDENELITKILEYLRLTKTATKSELEYFVFDQQAKGVKKQELGKALVMLMNDRKIVRKGREYVYVDKHRWEDCLLDVGTPVSKKWKGFKMPYFDDYSYFNVGDLIIIGGKTGTGKTILAQNFVKRIVDQGIKPYYVYNETGARWSRIGLKLGLKDGDYYHTFCSNPEYLQLEKDAVTIYDWVLPREFARTDLMYESLINKVKETDGLLICFVQLKLDDSYFAGNQIDQFAAWACRYLYARNDEENTKFVIDKIRDRKTRNFVSAIPCKYLHDSKEVVSLDELDEEKK